jgi:hypothetical protein
MREWSANRLLWAVEATHERRYPYVRDSSERLAFALVEREALTRRVQARLRDPATKRATRSGVRRPGY